MAKIFVLGWVYVESNFLMDIFGILLVDFYRVGLQYFDVLNWNNNVREVRGCRHILIIIVRMHLILIYSFVPEKGSEIARYKTKTWANIERGLECKQGSAWKFAHPKDKIRNFDTPIPISVTLKNKSWI